MNPWNKNLRCSTINRLAELCPPLQHIKINISLHIFLVFFKWGFGSYIFVNTHSTSKTETCSNSYNITAQFCSRPQSKSSCKALNLSQWHFWLRIQNELVRSHPPTSEIKQIIFNSRVTTIDLLNYTLELISNWFLTPGVYSKTASGGFSRKMKIKTINVLRILTPKGQQKCGLLFNVNLSLRDSDYCNTYQWLYFTPTNMVFCYIQLTHLSFFIWHYWTV